MSELDPDFAEMAHLRFFAPADESQAADLKLIQLLEHATLDLEQGKTLARPLCASLIAALRRLLVDLFRLRTERDRLRVERALYEQGQTLLPLQTNPKTNP